jgi:hypothetical protein
MPWDSAADASVDAEPLPPPPPVTDCPRVRVITVGLSLNVRSGPSVDGTIVGTLAEGAIVTVIGTTTGDAVEGNTTWHEIESGSISGFVSGHWTECTTEMPPPPRRDGYYLPLACGMSARISQGNDSGFSHTGRSRYAFDFSIPRGTPLHAMADGTVSYVKNDTRPGDPCYDGGGPSCIAEANMVQLRHADGTITGYAHLDTALVSRGDVVLGGTPIGRSGSSGYSTGPHAHVARQSDCGFSGCDSIPLRFEDVAGDGVPETGDTVTSGNCP